MVAAYQPLQYQPHFEYTPRPRRSGLEVNFPQLNLKESPKSAEKISF